MTVLELYAICLVQVLSSQCFAIAHLDVLPNGQRGNTLHQTQIEAYKQHILVTGKLVAELAKQQLRVLSGLTGTIIGGDLIADTPVGEITKYNLGGSNALSLNNGGSGGQINLQQLNTQQLNQQPPSVDPERKKPAEESPITSSVINSGHMVQSSGLVVHKPISVAVRPIPNNVDVLLGDKKEDDYMDISWILEQKPSTTTRNPLASSEDTSSEEHIFDGDQYVLVKKTTPAPWEVNPVAIDPFHGAPKPGPLASPMSDPPTDQLDPVMYPVILPDGGLQKPQTTPEEGRKEIYNPLALAALSKTGTNRHW